jgi:L-arabinokinase
VADVYGRRDDLVRAERIFLEEQGVDVVVADVPAIPIEAAKAAGLPALAVGNFSWDWIYSAFHDRDPRWAGMSAAFADGYAKTDLLLRLPFYGDMSSFPRRVDVGLVAAPGRNRRAELAALTGADTGKRWVLLSFTSLEWSEEALRAVEGLTDYEFFTVEPLGWPIANAHGVDRARVPFCDIMASVDGVVSKPGFGMLSECIVNRKPLLYADRTDFIEYPILVEALEKYLQNQHVPAEELYRGAIGPYLDRLWTRPAPGETVASDGAAAAVAQIARYLDRPVPYEDASRNLNPEP